MGVIHRQFKDFDGPFSYTAQRNRNFLTLAADQNLDAQGVRTLKGNGSVYVVLDWTSAIDRTGHWTTGRVGPLMGKKRYLFCL